MTRYAFARIQTGSAFWAALELPVNRSAEREPSEGGRTRVVFVLSDGHDTVRQSIDGNAERSSTNR